MIPQPAKNGCGVLYGSMVKCLTRNPEVLGSSHTGSSGFFVGVSLGKTLQNDSLVLVKSSIDMNNVSCRRAMIAILLMRCEHDSTDQSLKINDICSQ